MRNQIDFLKKQLEKAEDREAKANARIDTLLTLIEMKPSQSNMTTFTNRNPEQPTGSPTDPKPEPTTSNDEVTTPEQPKRYPVPEQVDPEPEQRGFWSRFFKPYG